LKVSLPVPSNDRMANSSDCPAVPPIASSSAAVAHRHDFFFS
jgi:hypothetical protein